MVLSKLVRISVEKWEKIQSSGEFIYLGGDEGRFSIQYKGKTFCWRTDSGLEGPYKVIEEEVGIRTED